MNSLHEHKYIGRVDNREAGRVIDVCDAHEYIFILDDDPDVALTLARLADACGLAAKVFTNASDFLHAIERDRPAYIAIDLIMPDMDGVEVLRQLPEVNCEARVILVSGLDERLLDAAALAAEEHGLRIIGKLTKPYRKEQLNALLTNRTSLGATLQSKAVHQGLPIKHRDIVDGIRNREFFLVYQPKIDCQSSSIKGFETLVRWRHPTHGVLLPDRFLHIAEECRLMDYLTGYIFSTALAWYKTHEQLWDQCGGDVRISINISARNLGNIDFADRLAAYCAKARVSTSRVILELTETSAMEDPTTSLELMTRLRMKGFLLSMDDFGTGYSSMAQLVRLPFSEIKVDKSFVIASGRSAEARMVVQSVIELGKNLGLQTTAEGVEDQKAMEFVSALNCNLVQGYYIAKPMEGKYIPAWVEAWTRRLPPEIHAGTPSQITSQVQSEKEVRAARRLRKIVDGMDTVFLIIDHGHRLTFVNADFTQLFGDVSESYIGKHLWDAIPVSCESRLRLKLEASSKHGAPICFQEYLDPIGIWIAGSAHAIDDGMAIHFRDVTQEHANIETLRLLEAATSRINDVLIITEAKPIDAPAGPRILYVNDAFVRLTGYTREEVLGNTPRMLQGELSDRAALRRIRHALETFSPVRSEIVNYTKSGMPLWFEIDIVPLADDSGNITHFVSVQRDISDRKEAEESLRKSEERFQMLASATQDVVRDVDLVSDIVWWNEQGVKLMGLETGNQTSEAEWIARIHCDDRDRVLSSYHEFLSDEQTRWKCDYRFKGPNDKWLSVVDRGYLIRNANGEPIRTLISMADLTERNELAARLRQSQKLEAVGQLTGGVAHDFNNLLTVILGNSELLVEYLQEKEEDESCAFAEMIVSAAERGSEMVARLLAFARKQPLEPQVISVQDMLGSMNMLLRRSVEENIQLEIVAHDDLWLATADPAQLESALLNLVVNARDSIQGEGRITIETSNAVLDEEYARLNKEVTSGCYVKISIADTGSGMPEEVISKVFEPFFTTKVVGKGSGLGLSMVYGFIKQTGGHITIDSQPGEGTTISLYVPRATSTTTLPESLEDRNDVATRGDECILVVEDDDLVREHAINLVTSMGYRVRSAKSGEEALAMLNDYPDINAVFSDMVMPGGMGGDRLAEIAQRERPGIKVLLTSGYTEQFFRDPGASQRKVEILAKPYRRCDLAKRLRDVLDSPKAD